MKRLFVIVASAFLVCALTGNSASAFVLGEPSLGGLITKWEPGPNTASVVNAGSTGLTVTGTLGTPGGATWSIMGSGTNNSLGDTFHPSGFSSATSDFDTLVTPAADGWEVAQVRAAIDLWASVSGFTNLGKVADGGVVPGGVSPDDPNAALGDIRVGAYPFHLGTDDVVILEEAKNPGTYACIGNHGADGGDIHVNNDMLPAAPNQLTWVDNPSDVTGNDEYDFFTVILHEVGHALGLNHTTVQDSIMQIYSVRGGAQRFLGADDIEGVKALYGPAPNGPAPSAPQNLRIQ